MLDQGRLPSAITAVTLLLVAAWILYLAPRSALHRAFSLFLLVQGLWYGASSIDDMFGSFWGTIAAYFVLATPFAAANFAIVFLRRFGAAAIWRRKNWTRAARVLVLVGAVAVLTAFFLDHSLYATATDDGPLFYFLPATFTVYAFIAFLAARGFLHQSRGSRSEALFLLAVAFALEPMFRGVMHLLALVAFADLGEPAAAVQLAIHITTLLLVLLTAALIGADAMAEEKHAEPTAERRFLMFSGLAGISGLAVFWLIRTTPPTTWVHAMLWTDAFWHLILIGTTSYALVRYRLFDADIKFRFVVKQSTFAALAGLLFVVLSESLERAVSIADNTIAIAVAVGIGLMFRWLQQLSGMIARRIMPSILDAPENVIVRKEEIYRATLEGILVDGAVTPKERLILETLARKLELGERDAQRIERELAMAQAEGAFGETAKSGAKAS